MSIYRKPRTKPLPQQLAEMSFAVPSVMAHRLTRMALAGRPLSARDRKEFHGMGMEKLLAAGESWMAMWLEGVRLQQRVALSWFGAAWAPWGGGKSVTGAHWKRMNQTALDLARAGMAPVHKRAVANARRLARTKLR